MSKRSLLYVPGGSTNNVYRWMVREVEHYPEEYESGGEILMTSLAENAAYKFNLEIDDPDHWIYDAAYAASLNSRVKRAIRGLRE